MCIALNCQRGINYFYQNKILGEQYEEIIK